jgi:hypothetical protein
MPLKEGIGSHTRHNLRGGLGKMRMPRQVIKEQEQDAGQSHVKFPTPIHKVDDGYFFSGGAIGPGVSKSMRDAKTTSPGAECSEFEEKQLHDFGHVRELIVRRQDAPPSAQS